MTGLLAEIHRIDAGQLPLVDTPPLEELMRPPYWGPDCELDEEGRPNVPAAAAIVCAAWAITGGQQQHTAAMRVLRAGGLARCRAQGLLEQVRENRGRPGHGISVRALALALQRGVTAQLESGAVEAAA